MRLSKAYVLRAGAADENVRGTAAGTAAARFITHDRGCGRLTKAAGPARA